MSICVGEEAFNSDTGSGYAGIFYRGRVLVSSTAVIGGFMHCYHWFVTNSANEYDCWVGANAEWSSSTSDPDRRSTTPGLFFNCCYRTNLFASVNGSRTVISSTMSQLTTH